MAKQKEKYFWADLRKAWQKDRYAVCERIENAVGSGHPDVEVVMGHAVLFLELKTFPETKQKIEIRPSQRAWFIRRPEAMAFVLARFGLDEVYCVPAREFWKSASVPKDKKWLIPFPASPSCIVSPPSRSRPEENPPPKKATAS